MARPTKHRSSADQPHLVGLRLSANELAECIGSAPVATANALGPSVTESLKKVLMIGARYRELPPGDSATVVPHGAAVDVVLRCVSPELAETLSDVIKQYEAAIAARSERNMADISDALQELHNLLTPAQKENCGSLRLQFTASDGTSQAAIVAFPKTYDEIKSIEAAANSKGA